MYSLGILIILRYGEGNEKKTFIKRRAYREIVKKRCALRIYIGEITWFKCAVQNVLLLFTGIREAAKKSFPTRGPTTKA